MLRMSVLELSQHSGVGVATIKRLEAVDGLPPAHARTLLALQVSLESFGIEFIGSTENAPGVCLVGKKTQVNKTDVK